MESLNELEIRGLLTTQTSSEETVAKVLKMLETSRSWEEKRPLWLYLYNTLHEDRLAELFQNALLRKQRIPFDILIDMCSRAGLEPEKPVVESVWKGLKKQHAQEDILNAKGFDKYEPRFSQLRNELVEKLLEAHKSFRGHMLEKFEFLKNQRMTEQAGRVLKRMLELFPQDTEVQGFKRSFDVEWARDVLANHAAHSRQDRLDRTITQPSGADQEMLQSFLREGETAVVEHREFAFDLSIALMFLEDFNRALEILTWAQPEPRVDWLRAELLYSSRRHVEALEHLNQLEIKYIEIPDTTFAVSYLRAQCLFELGQHATALEIMQSLARVRPNYRSAQALILEWTEGAGWE